MKKFLVLFLVLSVWSIPSHAQTHSATVSWSASPSTGVTYNVYRAVGACTSSPTFTKINTSPVTVLTYTDSAVTSGTTYCYSATAFSATLGESAIGASGTVQVVVPIITASTVAIPPSGMSVSNVQ